MTTRHVLLTLPLAVVLAGCPDTDTGRTTAPADDAPDDDVVDHVDFRVATVVEGLEHPWGMAFLPGDEGILVTERPGRLRLIRDGQLLPEPIDGVPTVFAQEQGGLLDVALHPGFEENRLVYLSYAMPGAQGATTAVSRGRLENGRLADVESVFVADAWHVTGEHFGSRIVFDNDGYLFISVGDRGQMHRAQNLSDHVATVIRLHDDGGVPADNPFVNDPGTRDEIYAYGNRNPQGMTLHPETGEVWLNEHGPLGGDEINVVQAGANYGWPQYNYGSHYNTTPIPDYEPDAGVELPLLHWTPALAPSGMTFYTGDVFPQWRGDLFNGGLTGEHLRRVRFDGREPLEQERLLEDRGQRIRDVRTGPDGLIYLLVDAPSAPLLRLEPAEG